LKKRIAEVQERHNKNEDEKVKQELETLNAEEQKLQEELANKGKVRDHEIELLVDCLQGIKVLLNQPAKADLLPAKDGLLPPKADLLPAKTDLLPVKADLLPAKADLPSGYVPPALNHSVKKPPPPLYIPPAPVESPRDPRAPNYVPPAPNYVPPAPKPIITKYHEELNKAQALKEEREAEFKKLVEEKNRLEKEINERNRLEKDMTEEKEQLILRIANIEAQLKKFKINEKEEEKKLDKINLEIVYSQRQLNKEKELVDTLLEKDRRKRAKMEAKIEAKIKKKTETKKNKPLSESSPSSEKVGLGLGGGGLGGGFDGITGGLGITGLGGMGMGGIGKAAAQGLGLPSALVTTAMKTDSKKETEVSSALTPVKPPVGFSNVGFPTHPQNININSLSKFWQVDTHMDTPAVTETSSDKYLLFVTYKESNIKMEVPVSTLDILKKKIAARFSIREEFRLEYFDEDFQKFAILTAFDELKPKSQITVKPFNHQPWQFSPSFLEDKHWKVHGGSTTSYKSFYIVENSKIINQPEYNNFEKLLKKWGKEKIGKITELIALQNDGLETAFLFYTHSLIEKFRSSPQLFKKETWKNKQDVQDRQWVHDQYTKSTQIFEDWSEDKEVPIIPMFHGTTKATGLKIAQTGFSTVATLDDGFYARGIYFTSDFDYASYYSSLSGKGKNPCIVVAFVSPGNAYPVLESPVHPNTLKGKAGVINPGYQSHFVCVWGTKSNKQVGWPCPPGTKKFTDELVLFQDAQALPKYIITVEKS